MNLLQMSCVITWAQKNQPPTSKRNLRPFYFTILRTDISNSRTKPAGLDFQFQIKEGSLKHLKPFLIFFFFHNNTYYFSSPAYKIRSFYNHPFFILADQSITFTVFKKVFCFRPFSFNFYVQYCKVSNDEYLIFVKLFYPQDVILWSA